MPRAVYSPLAEEDLIGIVEHIARDKPIAAQRWLQEIRTSCERLATQPEIGELRSGFGIPDCRSFTVGNYVVFFRPTEDGIEIARVVHGSRDMRNL